MGQGTLTKVSARYETPFWRERGLHRDRPVQQRLRVGDASTAPLRTAAPAWCSASWEATRRASTSVCRRASGARASWPSSPSSGARRPERPQEFWRHALARAALEPRRAGRDPRARQPGRERPRPARAGGPDPLGGHRNVHLLERLHGRRRPFGRAGSRGSARRAVSVQERSGTLREVIEELAELERGAGSPGEEVAAHRLRERFERAGLRRRPSTRRSSTTGTRRCTRRSPLSARSPAWPRSPGRARAARRDRRVPARPPRSPTTARTGAASPAARLAERRTTWNVVAETGDRTADRTLVLMAHHDAAPTGCRVRRHGAAQGERPASRRDRGDRHRACRCGGR